MSVNPMSGNLKNAAAAKTGSRAALWPELFRHTYVMTTQGHTAYGSLTELNLQPGDVYSLGPNFFWGQYANGKMPKAVESLVATMLGKVETPEGATLELYAYDLDPLVKSLKELHEPSHIVTVSKNRVRLVSGLGPGAAVFIDSQTAGPFHIGENTCELEFSFPVESFLRLLGGLQTGDKVTAFQSVTAKGTPLTLGFGPRFLCAGVQWAE